VLSALVNADGGVTRSSRAIMQAAPISSASAAANCGNRSRLNNDANDIGL